MSGFKVMSRACDQCLFSKSRIVPGSRAAQIIRDTKAKNCHFICHKATIAGGQDVACHEHHQLGIGQMSRIAERLGVIEWIDPDTLQASK